jgi:hypothetical protein
MLISNIKTKENKKTYIQRNSGRPTLIFWPGNQRLILCDTVKSGAASEVFNRPVLLIFCTEQLVFVIKKRYVFFAVRIELLNIM